MSTKLNPTQALIRASMELDAHRRILAAKGFKRPGGELKFVRVDADLYWDNTARKWVCDIYTTVDNTRFKFLTRKANAMLNVLLKSFV